MEMKDVKKLWSDLDTKLNEKLLFNEELLRKMNFDKSRQGIEKNMLLEMVNIGIQTPAIIYLAYSGIRLFNEPAFSIPAFISVAILMLSLISSIMKINTFYLMEYDGSPIVKYQQQMAKLRSVYFRFRKVEKILLPVLIVTITPVFLKAFAGVNVYERMEIFLLMACFATVFSFIIAFRYDAGLTKKFREAEMLNKGLEDFRKGI